MTTSITVRHNMEAAHRLSLSPGKCQKIHGHSMWAELTLDVAEVDTAGMAAGLDFSEVKREWRRYIDSELDHRLALNVSDELAKLRLPGTRVWPGDPTIENLARWLGEFARQTWPVAIGVHVSVQETATNGATWRWTA